jgi:hypothetical protein
MDKKQIMDLEKVIDFLEELSWLLESKKSVKLKSVPEQLRSLLNERTFELNKGSLNYFSFNRASNSNVHYLIGVLPGLFQDEMLFPSNAQIISFAEEVLNISISRPTKRSRYELIGIIVCETDKLTDNGLDELVRALNALTSSNEKLDSIRNSVINNNFSWNETIQKLTEK